jgi:hypothetical protein
MSQDISAGYSNKGLLSTESRSIALDSLDDTVDVLEMFPDKTSDTGIGGNCLICSIREFVAGPGTFDRDIIGEWLSQVRDLGTEDMSNVSLKDCRGVCPAHGENGQAEGAKGSVEGGHIAGSGMELSLVEWDVEIEGGVDRVSRKVLSDYIGVGRGRGVLDRDSVERFEGMYQTKGFAILLENTEPATVVRGRRRFVNTRAPLVLDDLRDFIENPARNGTLLQYPGNMRDVRDFNGSEVFGVEGASFVVSPGECRMMGADDPFNQLDFLREQEFPVDWHLVTSFPSDSADRSKVRRMSWKGN